MAILGPLKCDSLRGKRSKGSKKGPQNRYNKDPPNSDLSRNYKDPPCTIQKIWADLELKGGVFISNTPVIIVSKINDVHKSHDDCIDVSNNKDRWLECRA